MSFAEIRENARKHRTAILSGDTVATAADVDALLQATMASQRLTFMVLREGNPYGEGVFGLLHRRARLLRVAHHLDASGRRTVVAHELGHWFLHSDPRLALTRLNFPTASDQVEGYSPSELKEMQADVFAAEFLCPRSTLREDFERGLHPSDTAARLGIPVELATAQAVEALLGDRAEALAEPSRASATGMMHTLERIFEDASILVEGSPSSGRTTAVAARVAHLLACGRAPASIAVLSRNERGVEVLSRGFADLADGEGVQVWSGTMRGYCKELLRKYAFRAGLEPTFTIVDDVAAIGILARVARGEHAVHGVVDATRPPTAKERASAALAYRDIVALKQGAAAHERSAPRELLDLAQRYHEALRAAGALDAADLDSRALELLERDEEIASRVAGLHADILIDDYDDLTRRQQEILRLLSRSGTRIFATAGWVSIDGFRGADAAGATFHETDHPGASRIALPGRLDCVVPGPRVMRALAASRPCAPTDGALMAASATVAMSARDEARAIARRVEEWKRTGIAAKDQVVLARSHRALDRIAIDLRALGVAVRHDGEADDRATFAELLAVAGLRNERGGRALAIVANLPVYAVGPGAIAEATAFARRYGMTGLDAVRHLSTRMHPHRREEADARGIARLARDLDGLAASASALEFVRTWLFERSDHLAMLGDDGEGAQVRRAIRQFLGVCEEHELQGGDDADLVRRLRRLRSRTQETSFLGSLHHAEWAEGIAMMTIHAARGRKFEGVHLAALPPPCSFRHRVAREAHVFEIAITRARSRLHLTRCLDEAAPRWEGGLPYRSMNAGARDRRG